MKDELYLGRGASPMDLEISHALGSEVWDVNGKRYIDFHSGAGVGILGWAKEEIELAIRNSDRPSYVYPHFQYKRWSELAELLAKISPGNLTRSFRATGGSEAVEAAMQMAMMYTGRKKFISVEGSYHGNTLGALSLGSSENHKKFHNLLSGCEKVNLPLNNQTLQELEKKMADNEVAAFIMEPIICNLGVVIPEPEFMDKLGKLCKSHGTLLIMDEAITGFGRTGKLFASEHYNLKPDILILAKALSAGHAGIGAAMTTEEIYQAIKHKIGLYSSYGWHPTATDAAITNIRYLLENVEELFSNTEEVASLFRKGIQEITFKTSSEIRIKGMAIGVELGDKDYASGIKNTSLEEGLLIGTESNSLVFFPALNTNQELVQEGLRLLKRAVERV